MAASLKNMTGKVWGLTPETGFSVKSFRQKADSEIFNHKDHQGETDGNAFYDFKQSITVSGATTAAPAWAIGGAVSLANEIDDLGGVEGGTTLIHSVEISRENENVQEVTIEAVRRPTLTVA